MAYAPLYEATEFFTPFPDPESVFSRDVDAHCGYLLPLATIDLSHIDPRVEGRAHFIQPIEPWDGVVGQGGDAYFTYYCRENYVGYRYDASGRCELDTDFEYFAFARSSDDPPLCEYYKDVRSGFSKARHHFHAHGGLHGRYGRPPYKPADRVELTKYIGDPSSGGNWPETVRFPMHWGTTLIDGEEVQHIVPLTEDGRPLLFVGQLPSYNWVLTERCALGCDLLLFYDPQTRTGLTTFDWS